MDVVVGVDSGGSRTRALAITEDGHIAGFGHSGGGNPGHAAEYHFNIQSAIKDAIASIDPRRVIAIVAGIAGLDRPDDHEWADKTTDIEGLTTQRLQVNDADIALYGALEGRPGIIAIQGQGSMIMGKTETGRVVRNYDFFHYANAAAPKTGFRGTHIVLAGLDTPEEAEFVSDVLAHWNAETVEELRRKAFSEWNADREESLRIAGRMAPLVTRAAENGLPNAIRICELGAREIAEGIQVIGPWFESSDVEVCLSGSCGGSEAIASRVGALLKTARDKNYRLIKPMMTPVKGAALWALKMAGVELTKELKERVSACSYG